MTTRPTKKLGEVSQIKTGRKDANFGTPDGEYPFFTCGEKILKAPDYSFDTEAILVAGNGDVGACKYYKGKFEAYQRTYVIDKFIDADPFYLFYYLDGFLGIKAKQEMLGSAIPYIKLGMLQNFEIPLPPLDIQKAIVTKLDEAFAEIDEAIALTEESIAKTEEIKQSVLDKLFETGEYKNIPLSIICTIDPKKAQINNNGDDMFVSFVPMADMNEEKMYFKPKQIRKLGDVRKGYTYFENNDVLLAKVTPCFENGKSGIAENLENGIGFGSSEYIVLRSNGDVLSKRIYYIVSSKKFRKEGAQNMSGAVGLQRIKKERLHNYNIPLPPLSKQAEIVSYLDQVFAETSVLKSDYETKLTHLKEFKASILQSAFEGKLIAE